MKLGFVSSLIFFASIYSAASVLKKPSLQKAAQQYIKLSDRPSMRRELAATWGFKKHIERWYTVILSTTRALERTFAPHTCNAYEQYTVRVLIDEHALKVDACAWELLSGGGFMVLDEATAESYRCINKPVAMVAYKKDAFYVNGKRCSNSGVRIIPEHGTTTIDGTTYYGEFLFVRYKERILCINLIELESYVGCVLSSESWPGWPTEVNKVFAVMCRSYVLSHMLSAQKINRPYHVRNTNAHQNYHGIHANSIIDDAVNQTAGMILVYDQKPVLAMFDACCGGVIPAHIAHGIDFKKEPYLARPYACTFCKNCRLYSWESKLPIADVEKKLKSARLCANQIYDIKVGSRDKAGLAKTIHVKTKQGIATCKGKQIYSAIPEVKSYAFDLKKRGNTVVLSGYGHGHHLGVCQWGAREMVRSGYSYQQILSFYYPGTTLSCIM